MKGTNVEVSQAQWCRPVMTVTKEVHMDTGVQGQSGKHSKIHALRKGGRGRKKQMHRKVKWQDN